MMIRRIPLGPIFPGWGLLAALGSAYVMWEHQQGRHRESSAVCGLCWLNRIAPASTPEGAPADRGASAGESPAAGTSEQPG